MSDLHHRPVIETLKGAPAAAAPMGASTVPPTLVPSSGGVASPKPDPAPTVATLAHLMGIDVPPPDISELIEETATALVDNPKYDFLRPSDQYHPYYLRRIRELCTQRLGPYAESDDEADPRATTPTKRLVPPKAEIYTVWPPRGTTEQQWEIMKLTAEYVALHGMPFLRALTQREVRSRHFKFLGATHRLLPLCTKMSDAYSSVMQSDARLFELRQENPDKAAVLSRCLNRVEWNCSEEKYEAKLEKKQMAMTDWENFEFAGTIEFEDAYEDLPVPLKLEELKRLRKMENLQDKEIEDGTCTARPGEMDGGEPKPDERPQPPHRDEPVSKRQRTDVAFSNFS